MRLGILAGAALAIAMSGATAAQAAAPGYTTASVNMRTGPDTDFPSVGMIPEGDDIFVEGCLEDESWCDVLWDGTRGWVYSEYIAFDYRGEMTPLPDLGLEVFGIPVIGFVARDYWERYYVGRPWYRDRDRWWAFRPRPRPGWHLPPRGLRTPGWWRYGYSAPRGMLPPPGHGWIRPHHRHNERYERREDRREFRRFDDHGDRRDRGDDHRDFH